MEIFTFLRAGGALSRIHLVPIDISRADALSALQQFDAARARCFLDSDRQSLLAVLEAGFGTLHAFNEVIHHTFSQHNLNVRKTEGGAGLTRKHCSSAERKVGLLRAWSGKSWKTESVLPWDDEHRPGVQGALQQPLLRAESSCK